MNINELMVGDWVLAQFINGDRYARISCIAIDCAVVSVGDREYDHDYDSVLPIPLTEEILKANGWEKNDPNWPSVLRMSYKKDNHSTLSCYIEPNYPPERHSKGYVRTL